MAAGYNDQVIEAFRAGHGVVGGDFRGQDLLLLHHRCAKSGAKRVTPLLYWPVGITSVAVLASNYGAPRHRPGTTTFSPVRTAPSRSGRPPRLSTPASRQPVSGVSCSSA